MSEPTPMSSEDKIRVAGVEFSAKHVESAVLNIDGRTVRIEKPEEDERKIGYQSKAPLKECSRERGIET